MPLQTTSGVGIKRMIQVTRSGRQASWPYHGTNVQCTDLEGTDARDLLVSQMVSSPTKHEAGEIDQSQLASSVLPEQRQYLISSTKAGAADTEETA